jgi:protocatechuate 3,4-dioxygenase beta subunit
MKSAIVVVLALTAVPASPQAPEARPPAPAAPAATTAAAPKPRPTPTPAPVIEGTVKGPDNRPVDKALVLAHVDRGAFPFAFGFNLSGSPVTARTDAAGSFRLTMKGRGPYTVRVEADGLAAKTLDKVEPGARLTITLVKGGAIEGVVREGNTGSPVPRVVVEAREERRTVSAAWEADSGVVRAQTDDQGRFRLAGVAAGLHTVSARARGYDTARRNSVRTGGRLDLYLFPGSGVVGTVRDAQGQPVAKAIVRADGSALPMRFSGGGTPVATDAEGRFELTGLRPGRYRLVVRATDFAVATVDGITVEEGADAEMDVVLHRGAPLTGRLLGPNEKPAAGRVSVHEPEGPAPIGLEDMLSAEAGEDGRFRVERVAPGSWVVAVIAPGFAVQRLSADVGTAGTPVDLGDVVLETGLTIRGRVRDRAGSPIADALINGMFRRPGFGGGNMPSARSEADGTFVLAGLSPGTYRLQVRAQGYGDSAKSAEPGGEPVDFVLDAAGAVTGLVMDEAGRPVDSFRVMARPVVEETGLRFPPKQDLFADPEGRFTLDNVAPGTYVLQVSAPERADGVVSGVKVASAATVDVGRVRLGAGGTVRGIVVDGGGTPIAGATVAARSASQSFGPPPGGDSVSDAAGAFEVRGVPSGIVQVTGTHPNYAEGRVAGVEVDPAKGPAEVRLVLSQGGRVEGSVRRRDGTGVPDVTVQVMAMQAGGGMRFPGDEVRTTNTDGTFAVDHLPAGRANITLLVGGGGQYQAGPSKEVDVRDGETSIADFVSREILVSGRVTRGGAPAAGLRVSVRGERMFGVFLSFNAPPVAATPTAPQRGTALTREDGSYELLVDEPGKYTANASTSDGRVTYPGKQVDVPDADSFVLDLAFAGLPVTGVVIDRDTEEPIADAQLFATPASSERRDAPGGSATSAADGRFSMELDPGEYRLNSGAEGYARETTDLTVGSGGSAELRITLSRGGALSGRLVDGSGRPVGGMYISARSVEGGEMPRHGGSGSSLPDGSFQILTLPPGTYTLVAQTATGTFAIRTGLSPGQKDVTMTLRPGGQVQLLVRGPDGAPVEGAFARVTRFEGITTTIGLGPPTSAQGTADLMAPAGQLELRVTKEKLESRTAISVPQGGIVPVEVTLEEKKAQGPTP